MESVKPARAGSRVKKGGPEQRNIGGGRAGVFEEDRLPPFFGDKDKTDSPGSEEQRDPRVPVSKKWPPMLVWNSEEEGATGEAGDSGSAGEGPSAAGEAGVPGTVLGGIGGGGSSGDEDVSSVESGDLVSGVGKRRVGARGNFCPSTPDLFCEGPLDFDEEDPGKQRAALVPWEEAKAGPWAASRMATSGQRGQRRRAADASPRRCGGVGDAPPTPQLGRSNVRVRRSEGLLKKGSMWFVLGVLGMGSRVCKKG
ncbi:hypothetical protein NDU88_012336 [Pleurodeles waltl]|uniref:Uncharacterized protein n=1 Tax=Pleurodeles waltl TaxID=8319 RepID=A0AAV7QZV4_PLEWA|nr:hypothetical protein NDU88_012336 [Pleurodeles waltl]